MGRRWQDQREGRAFPGFAFDFNSTVVRFRRPPGDVEAKADPPRVAASAGIHAIESVEYMRQMLPGDSGTGILDRQTSFLVG